MNTTAKWYLPGKGGQPAGPYSTQQLQEWLTTGQLNPQTLCWEEGMSAWLPMSQLQPFAAPGQSLVPPVSPPPPKRRFLLKAIGIMVVAGVCCAAGFLGVNYWSERSDIKRAKELLNEGDYEEATDLLRQLARDSLFSGQEPDYLFAVASIKEFASAPESQSDNAHALNRPKRRLQRILDADNAWRERANTDLAESLSLVPTNAPDMLSRCRLLMDLLQSLKLGDDQSLAKQLFSAVKQARGKSPGRLPAGLDATLVDEILSRNPAMVEKLLILLIPEGDSPAPSRSFEIATIQRWTKEKPTLAKLFASGMVKRAERRAAAGDYDAAERLLVQGEQIHPQLREDLIAKRLTWLKDQVSQADPAQSLTALNRLVKQSPATGPAAADLYFELAKKLTSTNKAQAQEAMRQAVKLDPRLEETEEGAWAVLDLQSNADESKLQRYRAFLRRFPDSQHRNQLLIVLVADASAVYDQHGRWNRKAAGPWLSAAESAAEELLKNNPKISNVDTSVFELAKRLAQAEQTDKALQLTSALCEAVPNTPLKLEIEQRRSQWREQMGRGTLPPELDKLADKIQRELKVMVLGTPSTIRSLVAAESGVHVIAIAEGCTADKFTSDEAEILRQWVKQGGILWVTNDVLSILDIKYERQSLHGRNVCKAGTTTEMCPILAGCQTVSLGVRYTVTCNLSYRHVVPLLTSGGYTTWSLVPYGKGWVTDQKPIDQTKYDGARFWLNFRLFCLGWKIPGAPNVVPSAPPVAEEFEPAAKQDPMSLLTGRWQMEDGTVLEFKTTGTERFTVRSVGKKQNGYTMRGEGRLQGNSFHFQYRLERDGRRGIVKGTSQGTISAEGNRLEGTSRLANKKENSWSAKRSGE